MYLKSAALIATLASASAFAPTTFTSRSTSSLNIVVGDERTVSEKVADVFAKSPEVNAEFEEKLLANFPGALDNRELVSKVVDVLAAKGYNSENTLLATSLCCDELARQLEDDFNGVYGNNFNLGGLAGFPFAGDTGFGAMAAHIPDDGFCVIAYGPHVGVTTDGTVGKVERSGIELVDNCCGSAIAASGYVQGITDGGAPMTTKLQQFTDFQQSAVQELILPHGKRLADADNRMVELPYALYDSQEMLMREIVLKGSMGIKRGLALLGGIQINTGPDTLDYFVPLKFDYMNYRGEVVQDMLPSLQEFTGKIATPTPPKTDTIDHTNDVESDDEIIEEAEEEETTDIAAIEKEEAEMAEAAAIEKEEAEKEEAARIEKEEAEAAEAARIEKEETEKEEAARIAAAIQKEEVEKIAARIIAEEEKVAHDLVAAEIDAAADTIAATEMKAAALAKEEKAARNDKKKVEAKKVVKKDEPEKKKGLGFNFFDLFKSRS